MSRTASIAEDEELDEAYSMSGSNHSKLDEAYSMSGSNHSKLDETYSMSGSIHSMPSPRLIRARLPREDTLEEDNMRDDHDIGM